MKNIKCTLNELSSEQAVRVMDNENQSIMKGGGQWGGCCQYPPSGESSGNGGDSWWSWIWSWFQDNYHN